MHPAPVDFQKIGTVHQAVHQLYLKLWHRDHQVFYLFFSGRLSGNRKHLLQEHFQQI